MNFNLNLKNDLPHFFVVSFHHLITNLILDKILEYNIHNIAQNYYKKFVKTRDPFPGKISVFVTCFDKFFVIILCYIMNIVFQNLVEN